jgi:alpha-ketoglutarate-dependent 2,4-dichlorophenoxyacetate dioxygenase
MTGMIKVREVHPLLAAEITNIDLRAPVNNSAIGEIEEVVAQYPIIIFPDQRISDEQQIAFSQHLGPLQIAVTYSTDPKQHRLNAAITDVSNLARDNTTLSAGDKRRMNTLGARRWHTDSSYLPVPARYSLLSARALPEKGGQTEFADMRAAYDALPDHLREMAEPLVCEHNVIYSRGVVGFTEFSEEEKRSLPGTKKPLVRTHPLSGRKSLYLSGHASHVVGWPIPEGRDLLRELTEFATQPRFVYAHDWKLHDLVMWDNRATMHRGTRHLPETAVRDMHRTTVMDDTFVAPA